MPFLAKADLDQILQPRTGERMLELGPGTGLQTLHIAPQLGPGQLDIVDIQQEMLDRVMSRAAEKALDIVHPHRADARELPFEDRTFNAVYLVTALGEIPEPDRVLAAAAPLLKPGGRLVVGEFFDRHWIPFGRLHRLANTQGLHLTARRGPASPIRPDSAPAPRPDEFLDKQTGATPTLGNDQSERGRTSRRRPGSTSSPDFRSGPPRSGVPTEPRSAAQAGQSMLGSQAIWSMSHCASRRMALSWNGPIKTPSLEVVNVAGDSAAGRDRIQSAPNLRRVHAQGAQQHRCRIWWLESEDLGQHLLARDIEPSTVGLRRSSSTFFAAGVMRRRSFFAMSLIVGFFGTARIGSGGASVLDPRPRALRAS